MTPHWGINLALDKIHYKDIIIDQKYSARDFDSDEVNDEIDKLKKSDITYDGKLIINTDPIIIDQNRILIDGYIRLMAIRRIYNQTEDFIVNAIVINTTDENQIKEIMVMRNSSGQKGLSSKELGKYAREKLDKCKSKKDIASKIEEIARRTGRKAQTVREWTREKRSDILKERDTRIYEDYLADIKETDLAKKYGLSQPQISNIINAQKPSSTKSSIQPKPRKIFDFNYWNFRDDKKHKSGSFFGKTPEIYLLNLLWYHTNVLDVVVDPFAGKGTMMDACKIMKRRCISSDSNPVAGKSGIKKWDIMDGLHPDVKKEDKIKLLLLDPPYWIQARNAYPQKKSNPKDLTNMSIAKFNEAFDDFFEEIKALNSIKQIAILINPTIYNNGKFIFADHNIDFHEMINDKFTTIARYHLFIGGKPKPYEKDAKRLKICCTHMRDLWVYKRK